MEIFYNKKKDELIISLCVNSETEARVSCLCLAGAIKLDKSGKLVRLEFYNGKEILEKLLKEVA